MTSTVLSMVDTEVHGRIGSRPRRELEAEARNSKLEIRNNSEYSKNKIRNKVDSDSWFWIFFGFWVYLSAFVLEFDIRISDFL
jgi:hypothetical protein